MNNIREKINNLIAKIKAYKFKIDFQKIEDVLNAYYDKFKTTKYYEKIATVCKAIAEKSINFYNLLVKKATILYKKAKKQGFVIFTIKQLKIFFKFISGTKAFKWIALNLTRIEQDIKFGMKKFKQTKLYQKLAEIFRIESDYKTTKEFLKYKNYIVYFIAFWVIGLDQYTKLLAEYHIHFTDKMVLIPYIISAAHISNSGAAFGFLEQFPIIVIAISIIATIGILIYLGKNIKSISMQDQLYWGLILGGVIGNLSDRIMVGYVIDIIKLEFVNFPIFNIADVAINVGVFMLIYKYYIRPYVQNGYKYVKSI